MLYDCSYKICKPEVYTGICINIHMYLVGGRGSTALSKNYKTSKYMYGAMD